MGGLSGLFDVPRSRASRVSSLRGRPRGAPVLIVGSTSSTRREQSLARPVAQGVARVVRDGVEVLGTGWSHDHPSSAVLTLRR